jgi:hypothetical protein
MRVLLAGKCGAPCNSRWLDSSWSVSGHDRFDILLCERSALLTAEDLQQMLNSVRHPGNAG